MSILDVEGMLLPVSDEEPCGPNLEYDPAYAELEAAGRGKREQQYGDTIIPGEEPNWREVRRLGIEMLARTKDLRIGCLLARALIVTDGFPGFADGMAVVRGYVEQYWPTVHPQLDPNDDNDPTLRVNTVSSLSDYATTVQALRAAPMVSAPLSGRYSMRDLGVASGEIASSGDEMPTLPAIEAAFQESDLTELRNNTAAIRQCVEHADAIESVVTQQVGATRAVSLGNLRDTLRALETILASHLSQREMAESESLTPEQEVTAPDGQIVAVRATGEINSRTDVLRAIDKICEYYTRHEPSSPVPLLLGRARRLVAKNFLDIVKDLSPETLAQIQSLGGVDREDSGG
jgi:type VI secretion system protein ImpA